MKKSRRLLALVLTVITLMSVMAITAFAANTSDKSFSLTVSGSSYQPVTRQKKEDTSTVYLFMNDSTTYTHCFVQACGSSTYTSSLLNKTIVNSERANYVVCRREVKYNIHTDIYEDGYTYAALRFKQLNSNYSGTVAGKWSPDSVGSYTPAT